jgi:hypothetical protein
VLVCADRASNPWLSWLSSGDNSVENTGRGKNYTGIVYTRGAEESLLALLEKPK